MPALVADQPISQTAPGAAPPRPRSAAQIEASRRNGARSNGPVTADGKRDSSRNALRHGLAARLHVVLNGEDAAAFAALTEDLAADLGGDLSNMHPVALHMVRHLAAVLWRRDRAVGLETEAVGALLAGPFGRGGLETVGERRLALMIRYQGQLSREFSKLRRELRLWRRETAAEAAREEVPDQEPHSPENEMQDGAELIGSVPGDALSLQPAAPPGQVDLAESTAHESEAPSAVSGSFGALQTMAAMPTGQSVASSEVTPVGRKPNRHERRRATALARLRAA